MAHDLSPIERQCLKKKDDVIERANVAHAVLGVPLEYEVRFRAPIYKEPVPSTETVASIGKGETIQGYPGSAAWVKIKDGWVPIRDMGMERYLCLHAVWPEIRERRRFTDALEVQWRGFRIKPASKVLYSLEWRHPPDPDVPASAAPPQVQGNVLSAELTATIRGLPEGSPVQLRVGARVTCKDLDHVLSGAWQNFHTSAKLQGDTDKQKQDKQALYGLRAAGFLPKRHLRAVKGVVWGLEFRVNEVDDIGVFSPKAIPKGSPIEVVPLLRVDTSLRHRSGVLKKLTIPLPNEADAWVIPLGYSRLYMPKKLDPNVHWGHLGGPNGGEILLWAAEDIEAGGELTLDLRSPQDATAAKPRPLSLTEPPEGERSDAEKYKGSGYIHHGNSGVHGRGVFATKDLLAGQLLESAWVFQLDDAGAEALMSYRWGSKGSRGGPFYVPSGCGCLYNHSEHPNACVKLDLGRNVLEYETIEPLHVGQEIFINYGGDYFDSDFSGNNAAEFQKIETAKHLPKEIKIYTSLLEGLKVCLSDDDLQTQLGALVKALPKVAEGQKPDKEAEFRFQEAYTKYNGMLLEAQMPVLERFGYPRNLTGWFRMANFCCDMYYGDLATADTKKLSNEVSAKLDLRHHWPIPEWVSPFEQKGALNVPGKRGSSANSTENRKLKQNASTGQNWKLHCPSIHSTRDD